MAEEKMVELTSEMQEGLAKAIESVVGEEAARAFKPLKPAREEEEKEKEVITKDVQFILDIPLDVSVEIGRTRMLIGDLLQLTQGTTVELDKTEGEPVDILVNGRYVARGEVVLIGDKFGVRIIDIISPTERIKRLGKM